MLAGLQRAEHRQGSLVARRTTDCHTLIRYQRNAIPRLAKAIRST